MIAATSVYENYYKEKVTISPSSTVVRPLEKVPVEIIVSNEKDVAVYDVSLSICVDDLSFDLTRNVKTDYKEENEIAPFYLPSTIQNNGCLVSVLQKIKPHTPIVLTLNIDGSGIQKDLNISYNIVDYFNVSSLRALPISMDQYGKDQPQFSDLYDERLRSSKNEACIYWEKTRLAINPFYPDTPLAILPNCQGGQNSKGCVYFWSIKVNKPCSS